MSLLNREADGCNNIPLHPEQRFFSVSFHICGKGQLLRATCLCYCGSLCISITGYYSFSPKCFFFFFKGFRIPNLLGEGIYMKKKEPTNKVKSKNKDEERNGKGRRKNGGCDQSNFLWRGIALLGLSGSVPGLQLKVNFFY